MRGSYTIGRRPWHLCSEMPVQTCSGSFEVPLSMHHTSFSVSARGDLSAGHSLQP